MAQYLAAFALIAMASAAPRDRRQVFLAPEVAAPAILGAQQSPGGHVTGAHASISIHASPAIKTPIASLTVPNAVEAIPVALAADPTVFAAGVPLQENPVFVPSSGVFDPSLLSAPPAGAFDPPPLWDCEVEGKIKMINHNDDAASIYKNFDYSPDSLCLDRRFNICKWDQLIGDKGFVVDGDIDVDVVINVKGGSGDRFRTIAHTDFESPSKFSDVIFHVDGKRLHASKQILANASRFFEKLFYGDSEESEEQEIFLENIAGMEEISNREFRDMLEMVYHSRRKFDYCNGEFLLRMANQLEITDFIDRAEAWMLYGSSFPTHKKLLLADQYKLNALKGECLRDISDYEKIEELKNSKSYNHYSSELKDELFTKLLQFCKNLARR